jgi:hypothetical protein
VLSPDSGSPPISVFPLATAERQPKATLAFTSNAINPDDDYDDRKFRRQFGQHGHVVFALMIVVVLAIVKWVASQMPVP